MDMDNEALKAMEIYQHRHGGSLAEISILFFNVFAALREAAQQSVQRTAAGGAESGEKSESGGG